MIDKKRNIKAEAKDQARSLKESLENNKENIKQKSMIERIKEDSDPRKTR